MAISTITIDSVQRLGKLRALHGVNNGPYSWDGLMDLTVPFQAAKFPSVRLHDVHYPARDVVDINVVFPDMSRDPDDPAAYDFARTDHYLQAIAAVGCPITYRLGYAIDHHPFKKYVYPPADPARWARVCLGIARHYNAGWAKGYQNMVARWEILNEPDLRSGPHVSPAEPSPTWQGTWEQYLELYALTSQLLKTHNPHWLVGGPAALNTGTGMIEKLLEHCRRHHLPIDFCSWHHYGNDPYAIADEARKLRQTLDDSGFADCQSILDEWHYLPPGMDWNTIMTGVHYARKQQMRAEMTGDRAAAFAAATLLLLQDAPIDMANFYSGDMIPYFGIFDSVGGPLKTYYALLAISILLETPHRLPVQVAAGLPGLIAACGTSDDGQRTTLLLVNHSDRYHAPQVILAGQPLASQHTDCRMISSEHNLATWPVEATGQISLPPRSVALVQATPR